MPQQEQKKKQPQKKQRFHILVWQFLIAQLSKIGAKLGLWRARFRAKLNRATFAYLFMLSFIILTSIGVGLIFPPAGLVVAGVACGIFGFILGLE